jgi:hypothetical protein
VKVGGGRGASQAFSPCYLQKKKIKKRNMPDINTKHQKYLEKYSSILTTLGDQQ